MDAVLEASARSKSNTIQTLGPLIHNPQALDLIKKRGVSIATDLDSVKDGTIVIRAHGVPMPILRKLKERQHKGSLKIINATCPEVAKVQSKIKKWSPKGYFVVILGTHGHAESVAHQSFAQNGSTIVANLAEAYILPNAALQKTLVVAQTTFIAKDFHEISEYILHHSTNCIIENTICKDTWIRQNEAKSIANMVDYIIVVGGKSSSNTKHLATLAAKFGKPVQHVEISSEINLLALKPYETVGVMAGASTPTWLVDDVVDVIKQQGATTSLIGFLNEPFNQAMRIATGTGFLTIGICHWAGLSFTWHYPIISMTYTLAMYLLAPYIDPLGLESKGPGRAKLLERSRYFMIGVALCALLITLITAISIGKVPTLVVGSASLFGLIYKQRFQIGRSSFSLKLMPGSKDILVAVAIAALTLALPLWHDGRAWGVRGWSGLSLVTALVLARTTTYNLKDMQNDQILGRETLPILFGRNITKFLFVCYLLASLIATIAVTFLKPVTNPWPVTMVLIACTGYPMFYLLFSQKQSSIGRHSIKPWIETSFFLAGLLALT
jgi:4-hydroxy-3-methylbut-2-enyl diphosphate reductase